MLAHWNPNLKTHNGKESGFRWNRESATILEDLYPDAELYLGNLLNQAILPYRRVYRSEPTNFNPLNYFETSTLDRELAYS